MKIFKHILNFITLVTMIIFIFLLIGKSVLLDENNIKNHLEDINYYHEIYTNIQEQIENNTLESGLNTEELKNTVDEKIVKSEIDKLVDSLFQNKELNIDERDFQKKIDTKITEALNAADRTPSYEEKKDIERLEKELVNIYKEEISVFPSTVSKLSLIISKVKNISKPVIIVLTVLLTILIVLTIILNKKPLKELGTIFTACGIIAITLNLILRQIYQNISIISKVFSNLIVSIIDKYLSLVLVTGCIILLLGLSLLVINNFKQSKN